MGNKPGKDNQPTGDLNPPLWLPVLPARAKINSAEEWFTRRTEAYRELRNHSIPPGIIDAVQLGRARARLSWFDELGEPTESMAPNVRFAIEEVTPLQVDSFLTSIPARLGLQQPTAPDSAGELLAYFLRARLMAHGQASNANKRGKKSPVRQAKLLARSTIAEVATDLLEDCRGYGYAPGSQLISLISELLGTDRPKLTTSKDNHSRDAAAWLLAQDASIGVRELARAVHVAHTTVRLWRKDTTFLERVEQRRTIIELLKSRGYSPSFVKS